MRKLITCAAGALTAMMLAGGPALAQQDRQDQKGSAQRAGEKIDQAIQEIKKGVQDIGDTVHDRWVRAKASVENMGVESRIYGRLHWDKALRDAKIDLEVRDGVATLRGEVPDASARAKAVQLANDTVGVNRVDDRLTVHTPATSSDRDSVPSSRR